MPLNNWMAAYQNRKLAELIIPGSHDAGTINQHVEFSGKGTQSNAVTQDLTISQQLNVGTRFFDLRLKEKGGHIVAHHTTKIAGKSHGAFGTTPLGDMIQNAAYFCRQNPTEVVIFRISHTKTSTNAHEIVQEAGAGQLSRCTGNLCNRTLEEIRTVGAAFDRDLTPLQKGGLVVLFNEGGKKKGLIFKKTDHSANFGVGGANVIDQTAGIHSFKKYKGEANNRGIATCGVYTGTNALSKVVRNALQGQYAHTESHSPRANTHLWQVYWQKTYLNPFHARGIETGTRGLDPSRGTRMTYRETSGGDRTDVKLHGSTHAHTGYLLSMMRGHGSYFGEDYKLDEDEGVMLSTVDIRATLLPNILSYDFVNATINQMIVDLNAPHGILHGN